MKRFLSFVLAIAMFVSCVQWGALPLTLTAWGTDGDITITYMDDDLTVYSYVENGETWVNLEAAIDAGKFTLNGNFYFVTAGNYYLAEDYTLPYGLIIKESVTLNLNDNILTIKADQAWASSTDVSDSGIVVYGGNVTIVDTLVDASVDTSNGESLTARYWDGNAIQTNTSGITGTNTFTGGAITGGYNDRDVLGGGAICVYSGSLTLNSGNLVGNSTDRSGILGGAVYVNTSATFTMNNGSIIGNTSGGLAGAIYINNKGTFTLNNGTIAHNSTGTTSNYAGAVYNVGTFNMYGGLIDSNESMGGGAVSTVGYTWSAGSGTFTMYGGKITNNYASTSGGAVLVGDNGTFVMYDGTISGNSTNGTAGAVNLQLTSSTATIYGGSITGNTATGVAGAIRVNGGILNIGQAGSTAITITGNTGDGVTDNVYLFSGSTITQVGSLGSNCTVGVTLETGMGTAAVSSTSPAYAITAADTTYYVPDEAYYRILDGDTVILLEAGEIPGTDAAVEYDGDTIDITALDMFDLTARHGTATYTLADTGTGVGTLTENGILTVTQIGTFDIEIATSYTTTAEPKTGSATLTVKAASAVEVDWPEVEEGNVVPVGGTQAEHAIIDQDTGSATVTPDGEDSITVDGTFYWVDPSTTTQDAGDYTGAVYFVPDEKYDGIYDKYFKALTGEVEYSVAAPEELTGNTVSQTYGTDAIDVSNIGLFDAEEIAEIEAGFDADDTDYTITYTITPVTGAGSVDGTNLTVSTVGDFTVTITIATADVDALDYVGTATLTVEPKEVYITALTTEERGPVQNYYDVTLVETSGSITGIMNDDDVSIDFSSYTATIVNPDETYEYDSVNNAAYLDDDDEYTGTGSFAVTVSGLTLTGADAANYTVKYIDDTTVTINMSIPYIAWPAATTITYGETQADASALYGGKVVMMNTSGAYIDITELGTFEWVSPSEDVLTTGVYTDTGSVKFVLDTTIEGYSANGYTVEGYGTIDKAVIDLLAATTHTVSYQVEAAPVTFSVSDNSVAYGSYAVPTIEVVSCGVDGTPDPVEGEDYNVLYTQLVDGAYVYVTSPSEVGTYFVSVEFVSTGVDASGNLLYEYYHTGTNVSTGKQIGVLVIYDYQETYLSDGTIEVSASEPATYSLSFVDPDDAADFSDYDVDAALPQTIHVLPTLDTDTYLGWEDAQGIFYAFGSRYAQPEYDMTFYAVLAADNHTISGVATGYQDLVGEAGDAPISGVGVVLMSGNDEIATTTTDENGAYSFSVMPGRYTVVFTRNYGTVNIESVFADASAGDAEVNVYFPDGVYNVSLSLAAGMDGITVDGLQDILDELSSDEDGNAKTVETSVVFAINQVDIESDEYLEIIDAAATDGLTNDNIKLFYDVQITQESSAVNDGALTEVASVSENFAIYIPLAGMYQGKETYTVYRNNGSAIDVLTTTKNNSGEYIELIDGGQTLVIYAKASALYAIAFTEPAPATLAGTDKTQVYSTATIDVSTLGMFDLSGLGTATYTITEGTGAGTIVGDYLKVSSVGTFTVTVVTAATATASAMTGTATLAITPKEIAVTGLVGEGRSPVAGEYDVTLDADASASNTLIGVINSDTVSIDIDSYAAAAGYILDEDYDDAAYYVTDNGDGTASITSATFDISLGELEDGSVSGLTLTGDDAANYVLVSAVGTVEVSVSTPTIVWPTASDFTYGGNQDDNSTLDATNASVTITVVNGSSITTEIVAGTFSWLNPVGSTDDLQDAGDYTGTVVFTPSADADCGDAYDAYFAAVTGEASYTITPKEISVEGLVGVVRAPVAGDYDVTLDADASDEAYTLVDVISGDTVSINAASYAAAAGTITNTNYDDATYYLVTDADGAVTSFASATFAISADVSASGLTLTGADAGNYVLVDATGTVEVDVSAPAIVWPTASDFTYGGNQDDNSTLDATNASVTITVVNGSSITTEIVAGTFSWLNPVGSTDDLQDAGDYTGTVVFTPSADADCGDAYDAYFAAITGKVDYTIDPKEISVTDLVGEVRAPVAGDYDVTLDATASDEAYTLVDVISGDTVSIDIASYAAAAGTITNTNYDDAEYYLVTDTDGAVTSFASATFDISLSESADGSVSGLTLTGDDAANYVLVSAVGTVEVNVSAPTIVWPTASDFTYGGNQDDNSTLDATNASVTITVVNGSSITTEIVTGTFSWLNPVDSDDALQDAGDYTGTVVFTPTDSCGDAYDAYFAAITGEASYTITPATITVDDLEGVSRGAAEGDDYVELDTDAIYTLDGLVDGDDVSLVYDDAYGRIYLGEDETEDTDYTDVGLYTDNLATFDILAGGLALTGDDKDNYILGDTTGTVVISIATPYMAWPAATDIIYGQDLSVSELYGGKVIVYDPEYDNGDELAKGAYVTLTGTFTWLNTTEWLEETTAADGSTSLSTTGATVASSDIGSYSQYVTFTPSDAEYGETYDDLFTDTYHAVDVLIKATAVQFTVSDNDVEWDGTAQAVTVAVTASNGAALVQGVQGETTSQDTGDYIVQYYQFDADNNIIYIAEPTDVGTYFVAAYFTSSNYHHTGTLESTAKQIGVFYIREAESDATATYDVTFVGVDGTEYEDYAIADALAETIHILPTINDVDEHGNAAYIGWEYNGSVYDFGARFGQPATHVTFTAVEAPDSYAVSGIVKGQNLTGDEYDVPLDQIGVAIMQGSELIATTVTDENGAFTVYLPAGYYTIVITRDQVVKNEVSIHVEVADEDITLAEIDLPDVAQNTVLEIASGVVVTSVDGANDLLSYYIGADYTGTDDSQSNTVKVEVNPIDIVNEAEQKTEYEAIMDKAEDYGIDADYLKLFYDASVWLTSGGVTTQINTIPVYDEDGDGDDDGYLEIYITLPGTYQGNYTYQVYRYHTYDDGTEQVDILTTTPNAFGEKIEVIDAQTLKITAKFYSVYGIAYLPIVDDGKDDGKDDGEDDGSSSSTTITTITTVVTDVPVSPATGETGIAAWLATWFTALLHWF